LTIIKKIYTEDEIGNHFRDNEYCLSTAVECGNISTIDHILLFCKQHLSDNDIEKLFKTNNYPFYWSLMWNETVTLNNILEIMLLRFGCHSLGKILMEVEIGKNNLFNCTLDYGTIYDFECLIHCVSVIQFSSDNFGETNTGQILQHIGDNQNNIFSLAIKTKTIDEIINILFKNVSEEIVFNLLFHQKKPPIENNQTIEKLHQEAFTHLLNYYDDNFDLKARYQEIIKPIIIPH
jgi:hypothetical protein